MTDSSDGYYQTRYRHDENRGDVWRHIAPFLGRWIGPQADVLELGAGYCDFSNAVRAASRVAMDISPSLGDYAGPGVRPEVGDCADLSRFADDSFDVVFASNLLEHLHMPVAQGLVCEALRVLRPAGRLILMQPNFRLRPREYFDDYTHVTVFTDRSLADFLAANGYHVECVMPRFLPQSMKSRFAGLSVLVPIYLRSPIKPFAGQMLVVAKKPNVPPAPDRQPDERLST